MFKNCAPCTDCISSIALAKNIDAVMAMYNLIVYSQNYLKASGSLRQYYRDEPIINNDGNIVDFPDDPDTASFKYKLKKKVKQDMKEQKMFRYWYY